MTGGDVRGFLHVCCLGSYREVTWEIMHALLESRLYDRSVVIELGVLGSEADQQVIERLIRPFERFRIAFRSTDLGEYEFPTLGLLQDACQTWDGPVYYLHTKGVSHSPYHQYSRYWRQLMLDQIVTNHEVCLAELANADTVGANWAKEMQFYGGNFWWTTSSYIHRLPDVRHLQRFPPIPPPEADPAVRKRLQCEYWLHMATRRVAIVGHPGYVELSRELCWTTSVADIVNELLAAGGGHHVAELRADLSADDGAQAPPDGGYDVIVVDIRQQPAHALDVVERCLPTLSRDGAIVVHHSNPPSGWHQRPAQEFTPGAEWTGQVWRAVVEFRIRHPQCEVFTVDTDWGATVIRPSRRARHRAAPVDALDWTAFASQRNELLDVVSVAWFRRYLYADPYLSGSARLATGTQLCNVVIAASGLDSYLQIGLPVGETLADIIAPIRHAVAPHADATYRLASDDFFAAGVGLDRYDLIVVDALDEDTLDDDNRCWRDLRNALTRLSDRGWIVVHGANPSVARFSIEHPEFDVSPVDLDLGYTLIRRRAGTRRAPDATAQFRDLFCNQGAAWAEDRPRSRILETEHYANNRDLLLTEVDRNPEDLRSALGLAHSYFDAGDFVDARAWYARRIAMRESWWSGLDEDVYVAMFRLAQSMAQLGEPWPAVQSAFLAAWEFRPTRAEPLHTVARRYREEGRYQLGYLFAMRAAEIPFPEEDGLSAQADVYAWRAIDEQAVCASWIGKQAEAFTLWRRLLARPDLPDDERRRIAANRDVCVPTMLDAASVYPEAVVQALVAGSGDADVVVSLLAGPGRARTEHTLNSFLNCCLDVSRVGRFLVVDTGLSAEDRAALRDRYGFLEFLEFAGPGDQLAHIRGHVQGRLWLHLGQGWRFFAPGNLITRTAAVLRAEPQVFQVGINVADAVKLTGASAAEAAVRRAPDAGRYVLTDKPATGPAMFDTDRLDRGAGLGSASLDEVLCVAQTLITVIGRGNSGTRAISNTLMQSGVYMGEPIKEDTADLVPAEDMYEACRIIARYIPWRGGLEWDFGPVQTMPIPAEFTQLIEHYLKSVLASPARCAGWKLPETTLCYPWIKRLYPDIHYIFWVRNPRDCIHHWHHTDDLRDFGVEYPATDDPYLRRAISWKYQDDLVAATPEPRHRIKVRFEDFVAHQERELTRLEEYLGFPLARIPARTDPVDSHKELPGLPFPEFLKPAMRKYHYEIPDDTPEGEER